MSKSKSESSTRRSRPMRRRTLLAAGAVAVLGGGYLWYGQARGRHGRSFQVQGGERRPVLDPLQFPDRNARLAYMAAQKHPEVLDEVFCYCGCERPPFHHKSLLSCFATTHGAG